MDTPIRDAARTIRARAERARKAADRRTSAIRARLIEHLAEVLPPATKAWLIGSLAWGGFGERSDINLVVSRAPPDTPAKIEMDLCAALGLDVEVLVLEELPDDFRRRVETEGVPIHGP
jgi:predicted nucleotidyltransferase